MENPQKLLILSREHFNRNEYDRREIYLAEVAVVVDTVNFQVIKSRSGPVIGLYPLKSLPLFLDKFREITYKPQSGIDTTMIDLPKITPPKCNVYFGDEPLGGKFLGELNEYEFNALRIKIKQEKLKGFSVSSSENPNYRSFIQENGKLECWPQDLFNLFSDQLDILIDWS